jgi:hypothetical protein
MPNLPTREALGDSTLLGIKILLNSDRLPPVRYEIEPQTLELLSFYTQPNLWEEISLRAIINCSLSIAESIFRLNYHRCSRNLILNRY